MQATAMARVTRCRRILQGDVELLFDHAAVPAGEQSEYAIQQHVAGGRGGKGGGHK